MDTVMENASDPVTHMCVTGKTFPKKRYFMSNCVKQNFLKLAANKD